MRLIDSPGFAVIDAMVELNELADCYPEYVKYANLCKFRGCTHVSEPECEVKKMIENGVLSKERCERYKEIYLDLSKRRKIYEKD
jgi:ribosome biogenesis GTPase